MSKNFYNVLIFFYVLAGAIYGVEIILSLLHMRIDWLENYIRYYDVFINVIHSIGMIILSLLIGFAFWQDKIFKYKLSEISGILGIILFLFSAGMLMFWPKFVWCFMFAGILCLYAVVVPLFNIIYDKLNGNNWEAGALFAILSFVFLYFTGYKSNIRLNKIFAVDPRHFPFSKTLAGIVEISPYIALISVVSLVCFLGTLKNKKVSDNEISAKNNAGKYLFLSWNGSFASISLIIFCLALIKGGDVVIKNTAFALDFNTTSICQNVDKKAGVIYLDNKYELILVDLIVEKQHTYHVMKCILSEPGENDLHDASVSDEKGHSEK